MSSPSLLLCIYTCMRPHLLASACDLCVSATLNPHLSHPKIPTLGIPPVPGPGPGSLGDHARYNVHCTPDSRDLRMNSPSLVITALVPHSTAAGAGAGGTAPRKCRKPFFRPFPHTTCAT